MAKIGSRSISRLLFGRPLDKIDRHVAKYALQLFTTGEIAMLFSRFFFPLSSNLQIIFYILVSFYLGRETWNHAGYHYERNSIVHHKKE